MAWVSNPQYPGSYYWEGMVPDVLPPIPTDVSPLAMIGVIPEITMPVSQPVSAPVYAPAPVPVTTPALDLGAPAPPGAIAGGPGAGQEIATVLLLGLAALAAGRMKGLRL